MTTMLNKKKNNEKNRCFLIFLLKANDKFWFSLQVDFLPQSSIQTQLVCRFVRLWLHAKKVLPNIYLIISFVYLQLKHILNILKTPRQLELQNVLSVFRMSSVNVNLGRTLPPRWLLIKTSPNERIDQCRFT